MFHERGAEAAGSHEETRRIASNIAKLPVIRPARYDDVLPAFVGGACALLFWTGLIEALDYKSDFPTVW